MSTKKKFLLDVIVNMFGFGLYIVAQQIILLPIISKFTNDVVFSNIVVYISILNIICNSTGGELGNTRIVKDELYSSPNKKIGDFTYILLSLSPIIAIICFVIFGLLKYSILENVILILTILMANVRLYAASYFRLNKKFNYVVIQNMLYLIGAILGIGLMYLFNNVYLALILPELMSIIFSLLKSDILKMKLRKTINFKDVLKTFIQFGIISLMTNCMVYYDRLLIYPILGATAVSVYYAASSMSKISSLATNPISSVLLSWIAKAKQEKKGVILKKLLLANIPMIIIITLINIPITYIAVRILYSQYLQDSIPLILPLSLATAFSCTTFLTKSVLLKFANAKHLIYIYILHFMFFSIIGYVLSVNFGLYGFAIANLISKIELWLSFIILIVIIILRKQNKIEQKGELYNE